MSSKFEFTRENQTRVREILRRYPTKRAAMLPTLHLVHQQQGYITPEVEEYVAGFLEVPVVDVHEILTFYTLYFQRPMGRHHIRLCMSISCWIRKCDQIKDYLSHKLGVKSGEITEDGNLSWEAVPDCLGACELAPMMQLDKDYHGNLTPQKVDKILAQIRNNDSTTAPKHNSTIPQKHDSTTARNHENTNSRE
ncbi:NADH-quinone oxidoreductase subunit NuoE [Acidobacteria bacterium AH-259-O06]|nr:NADH-quinone oxidoreductase subunit NuoE [Acidobacteria bacterium AH-259-O06]